MSLLQALLQDPPPGEVWIALRPPEFLGMGTEMDPYNGATLVTTPVNISSLSVGALISGTYLSTVAITTATARRVRAINFGRGSLSQECFVIGMGGATYETSNSADATDCVVENCIVEAPSPLGVKETTCIIPCMSQEMGTGLNRGLAPFPVANVVRGCFIDCDYQYSPADVSSIVETPPNSGILVVTSRKAHNLSAADWFRMSGVQVASGTNQFDNVYNGSFKVEASPAPTAFTFVYKVPPAAPPGPLPTPLASSLIWVGRWPSHRVAVTQVYVTKPNRGVNKWVLAVITATPHFLVEIEKTGGPYSRASRVILEGLSRPDGSIAINVNGHPLWLTKWVSNKQFETETTVDPSPGNTAPYYLGASTAALGVVFQGVTVGGLAAVMEKNQIRNCNKGGVYHDTFTSGDFVCRDNFYSGVNAGPVQNLQDIGIPSTVGGYSLAGDGLTVTFSFPTSPISSQPHNYSVGQGVLIEGFNRIPGEPAADGKFNGSYIITSITTPFSFTYKMVAVPSYTPDASSLPTVRALWENRRAVVENNVIEIIPSALSSLPSVAISFYGALPDLADFAANAAMFSRFREVIIRNNLIRYVGSVPNAQAGNSSVDTGILVLWAENAIVTGNLVDLTYNATGSQILNPISHQNCKSVYYFKNSDAVGNLIQGLALDFPSPGLNSKVQEITTVVEEALALSFL